MVPRLFSRTRSVTELYILCGFYLIRLGIFESVWKVNVPSPEKSFRILIIIVVFLAVSCILCRGSDAQMG